MLSAGAVGGNAIELFNTSTALFVENQGQWSDEAVRYGFNGDGVNIAFTDEGLAFLLTQSVGGSGELGGGRNSIDDGGALDDRLDDFADTITKSTHFTVQFDGANDVTAVGLDPSASRFNYFIGDKANHRENVVGYQTVAYDNLYAGIDLHTFGRRDSLKYEFYVAPGADYRQISISYDGVDGLWIDKSGSLHVQTELGELVDDTPYIFQVIDGREVEVAGKFLLVDDDTYTFEITGAYDPNVKLIIDPDLAWGTFLGGLNNDVSLGMTVDTSGNSYITGYTDSFAWPIGGFDFTSNGGGDAFLAKLSGDGSHLWSTFIGGNSFDFGNAVAIDSFGDAYVAGFSYSTGWAFGGYDTSLGGAEDGFLMKISSDGQYRWATYLGGSGNDYAEGVAVDEAGNSYVTGVTLSTDWISGGYDTTHGGDRDAFLAKVSTNGESLWSTYLGGGASDNGFDVAVDESGAAYVFGTTRSTNWVSEGFDTTLNGNTDAFLAKVSTSGDHLWSTYIGGSELDSAKKVTVGRLDDVYVAGHTQSEGWVAGGYDTSQNGGEDAYLVRISSGGAHLWSTYLGGANNDGGNGVTVDKAGNVLVAGETRSAGWVSGGIDTSYGGDTDAYVAKLSPTGTHLWSTYLGGSDSDLAFGIALDAAGAAYVAGSSDSPGWISGGHDISHNGDTDILVLKIDGAGSTLGDFDSDGDVDGDDFLAWQGGFGITSGANLEDGDADADGDVDGDDFLFWQSNFGSGSGAGAAAVLTEPLRDKRDLAVDAAFTRFDRPAARIDLRPMDVDSREIINRAKRLRFDATNEPPVTPIRNRAGEFESRRGAPEAGRSRSGANIQDAALETLRDARFQKLGRSLITPDRGRTPSG